MNAAHVHAESGGRYDVCNGDADGLCAVLQWRLHEPLPATLVTGLKREIELLGAVPVDGAREVLVCDLSLRRNRPALVRLLDAGVRVRYFDHHVAGDVPRHDHLECHLGRGSEVCTSLLMDAHLGGRFRAWAVVGAYGDEIVDVADRMAGAAGFDAGQREALRRLGQAVNYNAYGEGDADVIIRPADLYRVMARWPDPLAMLAHESIFERIGEQRRADLAQALAVAPVREDARARVVVLPEAAWARRAIGCLANELAHRHPDQAQAVMGTRGTGDFVVSVRAPRSTPHGASRMCEAFGGGGRAAAAGIDALPASELARFIDAFSAAGWSAAV